MDADAVFSGPSVRDRTFHFGWSGCCAGTIWMSDTGPAITTACGGAGASSGAGACGAGAQPTVTRMTRVTTKANAEKMRVVMATSRAGTPLHRNRRAISSSIRRSANESLGDRRDPCASWRPLVGRIGRSRTSVLLLAAALWGCGAPQTPATPEPAMPGESSSQATPARTIEPRAVFPGGWACADSSALWTFDVSGDDLVVRGHDTRDGEVFEVSEVSWTGPVARFTSRMPSTNVSVTTTVRVLDRNRLKMERAGPQPWSCVAKRAATSPGSLKRDVVEPRRTP